MHPTKRAAAPRCSHREDEKHRAAERPRTGSGSAEVESSTEVRVACAIPARYASSRLPGKVLLDLCGQTMIQRVYERAAAAHGLERVVVLTDDERVARAVEQFGGECQMTPAECRTGTDRTAWAARHWHEEAVISLQGDEPLVDPFELSLLATELRYEEATMATLAAPATAEEVGSAHHVKVVTDLEGFALYFSRAPIPAQHPSNSRPQPPRRHIGIYGYRREVLLQLAELEPTPLELCEGLEQLRALEHGIRIRVLESSGCGFGVDTESDLERMRLLLTRQASAASTDPTSTASMRTAGTAQPQSPLEQVGD